MVVFSILLNVSDQLMTVFVQCVVGLSVSSQPRSCPLFVRPLRSTCAHPWFLVEVVLHCLSLKLLLITLWYLQHLLSVYFEDF